EVCQSSVQRYIISDTNENVEEQCKNSSNRDKFDKNIENQNKSIMKTRKLSLSSNDLQTFSDDPSICAVSSRSKPYLKSKDDSYTQDNNQKTDQNSINKAVFDFINAEISTDLHSEQVSGKLLKEMGTILKSKIKLFKSLKSHRENIKHLHAKRLISTLQKQQDKLDLLSKDMEIMCRIDDQKKKLSNQAFIHNAHIDQKIRNIRAQRLINQYKMNSKSCHKKLKTATEKKIRQHFEFEHNENKEKNKEKYERAMNRVENDFTFLLDKINEMKAKTMSEKSNNEQIRKQQKLVFELYLSSYFYKTLKAHEKKIRESKEKNIQQNQKALLDLTSDFAVQIHSNGSVKRKVLVKKL
ncbi:MAG: hypothetical protein MHPSP_000569, partial [Paramarteilia canceri]